MDTITTDKISLKVSDGTNMSAFVAKPAGTPTKAILVIQEAFGVNDYIQRVAKRFAQLGFLAVAPELYHRTAPPGFEAPYNDFEKLKEHFGAVTETTLVADMEAALAWLHAQNVPENKTAVIGFCLGGRAAFLANASFPLAASVSFYGGGIAQTLLPRAKDLHAPQLLMWGGQDTHILAEHRDAVSKALTEAGKPFEEHTFPEAGHGFACDVRDSYHEPSATEAWKITDAFLAKALA
jgi:carboxymethylenebutenolidase